MVDHTLSIILLIAISAISNVYLQVDICDSQLTCGDCIKADASCHWCSDPAYTKEKRCGTLDHHAKMKCGKRFIAEKENKMSVMTDLEFNEGDDDGANSVQLKPQAINLILSPFKPQTIKVHFRRFNHPVDLYYLMDLSYTMLDDKDTLESLGNQLATKMKQLTKIFRVGFGSFVDKVTLPYTSLLPAALKKPCNPRLKDGKFVDCVPPYLFKNHLNLTSETAKFTEEVNRSEISGNLDGPEGGLEALMQVMVCGSEVGWARNNNARRIVVFVTDSTSHIAGDGKLGGILVPNDEKCHMHDNEYTHGLHHDYPSVSQISYQAHKNNVIVIFAVTKEYSPVYLALSERIYGSRLARLEEDSSNIVDIITEEYKSISQSVTLDVKSADLDIFDIKFTNNCTKTSGSRDPKKCDKLNLDETVEYEVTITAKKCPNDGPAREQLIQIGPGLFNDIINITVKLDCDCDCEKSSQVAPPGAQCQNGGSYHCGICKCPEQYAGNQCECDLTKESDKVDGCLGDKNGSVLCSNRGDCKCGACLCTHSNKYGGEFCQLSKEDCPQHENQLCSGHGSCLGGRCTCHAPWSRARL
ncbi:Integrin beta-1-B [Halotydeus destructor]|nr:Integrin beta-1-B [Halotydeus destructor]